MPQQQADPDDIAKWHGMADTFLQSLMALVQKPPGQLSKQDVFQSAAGLMGKGLFSDPQSRNGLVQQLTQLPSDEAGLRAALGKEILQIAGARTRVEAHAAQGQAMAPGRPTMAPGGAPVGQEG